MKYYYGFFFFILLLNSCKEDCKNIQVPYSVNVPFTESTLKLIKLSLKTSTLTFDRKRGVEYLNKPRLTAEIMVTNTSNYDGSFLLSVTWECLGQEITGINSAFIQAGSSKRISISQEIDDYSFPRSQLTVKEYEVVPPTVQINDVQTKFREEIRYKICNTCDQECMNLNVKLKK